MITLSKPISAGQAQAYHKEEFAATHPAAMLERGESLPTKATDPDAEALFSALEAEAEEDRE